jgi:hypothetical protein
MDHPDFRVRGKIFATLQYPDKDWGMVKLSPEQQQELVQDHPLVFVPVKGGWGRRGATSVRLAKADAATLRRTIAAARRRTAPKALAAQFEDQEANGYRS